MYPDDPHPKPTPPAPPTPTSYAIYDRIHVTDKHGNLRAYALLTANADMWTVYRADRGSPYGTADTKAKARSMTAEAAAAWCAGVDQEIGNEPSHRRRALAGAR